ncbi:Dps family protein [Tropheryma whipplei]|uniref:Dps family protein n=1 Tax=Tropheryma whipplei TaxID=2039 RepID=UPI002D1E40A8|nr:DNA starvation/stationary phase protection protein [Tropheryma whipplei]
MLTRYGEIMTTILREKNETALRVSQFLGPIVVNLTALSVDFKQLHWHVRGGNFIALHRLLDEIIDHAREAADVLAERAVSVGVPVDGRIASVAAETSTPAVPEGFINSEQAVDIAVAQLDAVLLVIGEAIENPSLLDAASQDAVIEVARTLDKDRWFLLAHKTVE